MMMMMISNKQYIDRKIDRLYNYNRENIRMIAF